MFLFNDRSLSMVERIIINEWKHESCMCMYVYVCVFLCMCIFMCLCVFQRMYVYMQIKSWDWNLLSLRRIIYDYWEIICYWLFEAHFIYFVCLLVWFSKQFQQASIILPWFIDKKHKIHKCCMTSWFQGHKSSK